MKKIWVLLAMFFVPGTLLLIDYPYEINNQELHDLIQEADYIAHAGGGYNGMTYTNSVESYELAMSKGVKLIEFDMYLVGEEIYFFNSFGDFEKNCGVTIDSFDEIEIAKESCPYTMAQAHDLEVITSLGGAVILDIENVKGVETFTKISELIDIEKVNLIPQVYDYEMAKTISKMNLFDHIIYRNDDRPTHKMIDYLNPNISMSIYKEHYTDSGLYHGMDRKVFLYTINKDEVIPDNVGIYTDDYYL